MDGKVAAEDRIKELLKDPKLMAALRDRAPVPGTADSETDTKK